MRNDKSMETCYPGCQLLMWWMALVVTVFAVPSFGIVVAYMVPIRGFGQVGVFVLACWLCTYIGMKIMQKPSMKEMIGRGKKPE